MRKLVMLPLAAWLTSCAAEESTQAPAGAEVLPASFDGADYSNEAAKIAHGKRLAELQSCAACHGENYEGVNFGEMIPLVDGLWATNISQTLPDFSDEQLEALLREGVHPERDIYLMPSRTSQFLSDADMDALITYLRTIEPVGERTPLPPEGFEDAVARRLPDDYWRVQEYGRNFYPNSAEEVRFYAKYRAADLGPEHERGRYIAAAQCTSCHGPGLDGYGEESGPVDGVIDYSDAEFERLLVEGTDRQGQFVTASWGEPHRGALLTQDERDDVKAYIRALAESRVE